MAEICQAKWAPPLVSKDGGHRQYLLPTATRQVMSCCVLQHLQQYAHLLTRVSHWGETSVDSPL